VTPLQWALAAALAYGAWRDHRTRTAPSWLFYPVVAWGLWSRAGDPVHLAGAAALTAAVLVLVRSGRAGLADAKAVAAASLALPWQPVGPLHAPAAALALALGLSLLWPLSVAFRNALKDGPGAGVRWSVRMDREAALASMGWLGDGTDLMDAAKSDLDEDGVFEVTPSVPFLVPLAAACLAVLWLV
jgi:hypothetical protein